MYRSLRGIHPGSRITYGHTIKTVCIEQCIILRKLLHTDNIFKSYLLKRLIPWFCTGFDIWIPFCRHQAVDIKDQLLFRLNQFSTTMSSRVRRFDTPALCITYAFHFLSSSRKVTFQLRCHSQARISQTGSHRFLRQDAQHFIDHSCQRHILIHAVSAHQCVVNLVRQFFTYSYIILCSRHSKDGRLIRLQGVITWNESVITVGRSRRERLGKCRSFHKQSLHIHYKRRTVRCTSQYFKAFENTRIVRIVQCTGDITVTARIHRFAQQGHTCHQCRVDHLKAETYIRTAQLSRSTLTAVACILDRRSKQHFAS